MIKYFLCCKWTDEVAWANKTHKMFLHNCVLWTVNWKQLISNHSTALQYEVYVAKHISSAVTKSSNTLTAVDSHTNLCQYKFSCAVTENDIYDIFVS